MNNIPNPRAGRPMKSRGKNEDELIEFEVNVGKNNPKNHKNLEKLVEADTLHLKHHPSPDDAMELLEDKNKLRLIKYIDTKWFNPDNSNYKSQMVEFRKQFASIANAMGLTSSSPLSQEGFPFDKVRFNIPKD
jgi:hypothetical protein